MGSPCPCWGQNENPIVYSNFEVTQAMSCPDAAVFNANPANGRVINFNAVTIQCNPDSRLACCQGNTLLGSDACGVWWGPTNNKGQCDQLMLNFCNANPTDPLCYCIKPVGNIPIPECNDTKCVHSNAMRLSNQINNTCQGIYLTCEQYVTIDPSARGNVINNVTIEQNCNVGTFQTNSSTYLGIIIGVCSAVVIVLVIITAVIVVVFRKKRAAIEKQKKIENLKNHIILENKKLKIQKNSCFKNEGGNQTATTNSNS